MRVYIRPTVTEEDFHRIGIDLDVEENYYWLMDSKDSFHGDFDDNIFKIMDNRFKKQYLLPITMVKCEQCDLEPNTTLDFMYCVKCNDGLAEGIDNMPEDPSDLYS